ncbi:MAG: oligosaccharide flippase family protein [Eubacteriales bacterium]
MTGATKGREKIATQKNTLSKNKFFTGVVILTVSNLLVKVAGLLFKVPMNYIVGDTGMGYYNSAYSIYTLFYMLSTSGLPVAISVMVSEKKAEGNIAAAKTVFRLASVIFASVGLAVCAVMFFASDELAELIKSDKSALSVAVAAPTMFFICVSSAYRGYFQGCGNMLQTAVSQLIEAMGKLVVGVAAALYAIRMGYEIHIVAAYAVAGLTLGSLCGMVYLMIAGFLRGDRDLISDVPISNTKTAWSDVLRRFVKISIPVTLSASVMSLTNTLDTAMIQRILTESGMTGEQAASLYGNYTSLAVPMFNLPPVLVYPIAYSLVPVVAAASGSGNIAQASEKITLSLKYAVIIGLPCAMGLSTLADPILCLLYKESSAHTASFLLTLLAPSSMFVCILAITNSVLQGCGKENMPVLSMLVGGAVKLVSGAFLLRIYGISGAPVSTFLCYLTVTAMNLYFVAKYTGVKLSTGMMYKPLLSSLVCVLSAALIYRALAPHTGIKISCLAAILLSALVYAGMLILTGEVRPADIGFVLKKKLKIKDSE